MGELQARMAREGPCGQCGDPARGGPPFLCPACHRRADLDEWATRCDAGRAVVRGKLPHRIRDAALFGDRDTEVTLAQRVTRLPDTESLRECARRMRGATIKGAAGSGKSTLAAAMLVYSAECLRGLFDPAADEDLVAYRLARAERCEYVSAFTLARARLQTGAGAGEAFAVATCMGASVLLIDDLGAEPTQNATVAEVIHYRADNAMPTIVTTWMSAADIARVYGDGVARRLHEDTPVIVLGS
jgi:DNA replication protein DnaC